MSGVDVWGYAGNLAHTQHLTHKGVVDAVLYRTNLDYLKGYTVTGVTHGHDGHLQPRVTSTQSPSVKLTSSTPQRPRNLQPPLQSPGIVPIEPVLVLDLGELGDALKSAKCIWPSDFARKLIQERLSAA